jgi:acyl dehydratase
VPVDPALIGRSFGPTAAHDVTDDHLAAFAAATGTPYAAGGPAPATYPIVVAFEAMTALMADGTVGIELRRVVHGEQRFSHVRPIVAGDRLQATLKVDSVRTIAGTDIIGTTSAITDADGSLVCTAKATLVHRGEDA